MLKLQRLLSVAASKAAMRSVDRIFRNMWFDTQTTLELYERLVVDTRDAPVNLPEQLRDNWSLAVQPYLENL